MIDDVRFVKGKPLYSYDNGKTWTEEPRPFRAGYCSMVVTQVDPVRGIVTLSASTIRCRHRVTVHERRAARARWLLEADGRRPDLHARRASQELIDAFARAIKVTRRQLRRQGVDTRRLSSMDLWTARQTGFLR